MATATERRLLRATQRRAAGLSPRMTFYLLIAYDVVREELTERELARAIADGSIYLLLEEAVADLSTHASRLRQYVTASAIAVAGREIARLPKRFSAGFDALDPAVVEALRRLDTRVVRKLTADVRGSMTQAVEHGFRTGLTPTQIARNIRVSVGLTPTQSRHVEEFRAWLMSGDRKALGRTLKGLSAHDAKWLKSNLGTKSLTTRQVARMTGAYRRRLVALNTETTARTFAFDTARLAHRLGWENAAAQGLVAAERLTRTWIAFAGPAGDGRNRPHHLVLHGTKVSWNQPYPNGQMVPGETDFNCRCVERITVGTT